MRVRKIRGDAGDDFCVRACISPESPKLDYSVWPRLAGLDVLRTQRTE